MFILLLIYRNKIKRPFDVKKKEGINQWILGFKGLLKGV